MTGDDLNAAWDDAQHGNAELDATWDSVAKAPEIEGLDPVERLLRQFRGAVAANKILWRVVDLEGACTVLADLARARQDARAPIALDAVRTRLVANAGNAGNARTTALHESLLAFAHEATQQGDTITLPRELAALSAEQKRRLLAAYYERLTQDSDGSAARQKALNGVVDIFAPAQRTERLKTALIVVLVIGVLALVLDERGADSGPVALHLAVPDDAVPCSMLHAQGQIMRCMLSADAVTLLAAQKKPDRQQRWRALRAFAESVGYADILVVDTAHTPITP